MRTRALLLALPLAFACGAPAEDVAVIVHVSDGAVPDGVRPLARLFGDRVVLARVSADQVETLARRPGIGRVTVDRTLRAPVAQSHSPLQPSGDWNLERIHAAALWREGATGAGVVVANLDTGVDGTHPDLAPRFRGRLSDWFDPIHGTTMPVDALGHGTQTMGIMVAGALSGAALGVAPDASWIAARVYDDSGQTTLSVLHRAFAWALDPDGDPTTDDAPDVVNASFGEDEAGACDDEFAEDLAALRQAGIFVVFAAGNSGPRPSSSISPANLPGIISAGASDRTGQAAPFSSRGPSPCSAGPYPTLLAPGVDVSTTDLSFAGVPVWTTVSGTSFAAPHVAGAAALLLSAQPGLSVDALEAALRRADPLDVAAAAGLSP